MDSRPGVRQAYHAANHSGIPTLDEVCKGCPSLDRALVKAVLEQEGLVFSAGSDVRRTQHGVRPVYDEPVQMAKGEPPVIRTTNGIRPAMGVAYEDHNGITVVRTLNGTRVVRGGGR